MAPRAKEPSAKPRTKRRSRPAKAAKKPAAKPRDAACERFVQDLLARGEAVKPGRRGKLPPGATHVVQKGDGDGRAAVKRVRFKLV